MPSPHEMGGGSGGGRKTVSFHMQCAHMLKSVWFKTAKSYLMVF